MKASEVYSPTSTGHDFLLRATRFSVLPCLGSNGPGGGLIDQKAHLWVGGLERRVNAELLEGFGRGRADRADAAPAQLVEGCVLNPLLACDLREVVDLRRRREEGDVEFAGGDAAGSFAQRLDILGETVFIDADGGHVSAAGAESIDQFWIRAAVFLQR